VRRSETVTDERGQGMPDCFGMEEDCVGFVDTTPLISLSRSTLTFFNPPHPTFPLSLH
jgi:hypothetical protein